MNKSGAVGAWEHKQIQHWLEMKKKLENNSVSRHSHRRLKKKEKVTQAVLQTDPLLLLVVLFSVSLSLSFSFLLFFCFLFLRQASVDAGRQRRPGLRQRGQLISWIRKKSNKLIRSANKTTARFLPSSVRPSWETRTLHTQPFRGQFSNRIIIKWYNL